MNEGHRNNGRMAKRPSPPPLYIGQWIRNLGYRPRDVARGAPVNEGYLSELIKGTKKAPSVEVLHAIAVFLKIPRDALHKPPPPKEVIDAARAYGPAIFDQILADQDPTKH